MSRGSVAEWVVVVVLGIALVLAISNNIELRRVAASLEKIRVVACQ